MKKIKLISSFLGLMSLFIGCTQEGIDKDTSFLNSVSPSSVVSTVLDISTDNSGNVKITPTGEGVASYDVIYGHANGEATVVPGNSVTHSYPEGTYTVTIITRDLAGNESVSTYPLKVTYRVPEDLVVTVGNDFSVKAVAKYVKSFLVYYGDVANEAGKPLAIGQTLPAHVYPSGGPYVMKVEALSGGVAKKVKTLFGFPIDFDEITTDSFFGTFGNVVFDKVVNPSISGINTSATVGMYTKPVAAESWSGTYSPMDIPIDMAYGKKVKVWVYNTDASNVGKKLNLELENGVPNTGAPANGGSVLKVAITKLNAWEELVFDFSTIPAVKTTAKFKQLVFRFNDSAKGLGEIIYIDNIRNTN
jgi:hypothetical protein